MKPHIKYKQLLEIVSWGIFSMNIKRGSVHDKRLKKCEPIKGAMHNGIYVGSPGKDIYLMLPYLTEEQMKEVAENLSKNFPSSPPVTHVQYTACIRFIYGQFDKQGVLRSEEDLNRMKGSKPDWELSRKFLSILSQIFDKKKNFYGLTILAEMEAHRLGDEAILEHDKDKLNKMRKKYEESVIYAYKCNSYKHMFSMDYWAGEYFMKFGDTKRATEYFEKAVWFANKYYYKYFKNGESYYSARFKNALNHIKKQNKIQWKYLMDNYKIK